MSEESEVPADRDEIAEAAGTDYPLLHLLRTTGRPHLPYLGLSAVAMAVSTFLDRADVFVLGLAFDAMFNDRAYSLPLIPDAWIPTEPMAQLYFTVALLVAMKLVDVLGANLGQVTGAIFTQRTLHDVRVEAFDATQRLELAFFEGNLTGDVMSVLNNDVNTLETFFRRGITFSVRIVILLGTVGVLMALLNWQLALFVLIAAPVIAGVNLWFSRVLERLQDVVRSRVGALNARLEANLSGVPVIKTYTAEAYESDRVEDASYDHYESQWDVERISARHRPSMRVISGASLLVTFVVGAHWVVYGPPLFFSGELTAGQLIPFLFYLQQLTGPMQGVAGIIGNYKSSKAAARRVVGLQQLTEETAPDGSTDLRPATGEVEYDDVTFAYPGTDEPVLRGISFDVEPGETVGFVGSTGAGKSTLIKLLLRFYDVTEPSGARRASSGERSESDGGGAVRVDGHDVRDLTRESLRAEIGYVDQDPFLFNGTVAENVAYGDPDLDPEADPEETRRAVVAAATEAGAHEFVRDLPDGYDTEVGERGVKLSGGQRQRIAIARAIVGDPAIMVFDEATSHVDNETEVIIQENMDALTEDRTTFVIAHRLSTVRDADRVLVLDDGELVEEGTHDDLLDREGTYADLWRVQIGEVDALPADFVADATRRIQEGDD